METDAYFQFTTRARLDKAINSLLGIVEGITIDSLVDVKEMDYLARWVDEHRTFQGVHPFNEFFPILADALEDGVLDKDERLNIKYLCEKLLSLEYYDLTTANLQRLHTIMGAIAADGVITEGELNHLADWLNDHEDLQTCWPYDEVYGLITGVMSDKKIDPEEHARLLRFFSDFVDLEEHKATLMPISKEVTIQGVCAVCPPITFENSLFCFTGASKRYTRDQFITVTRDLGGKVSNHVSPKLHYLVIGAAGNPCWAYACYGRKVEEAVKLRKLGHHLLLIHENDFHDAASDA